jgi:hypothetical protein
VANATRVGAGFKPAPGWWRTLVAQGYILGTLRCYHARVISSFAAPMEDEALGRRPRSARQMKRPTLKCPFCGCLLPDWQYKARTALICPGCSEPLRLARWYLHLTSAIALGLTFTICLLLLSLRGLWLFAATVFLWFPIAVAWNYLFGLVFPPRLEHYPGDAQGARAPSGNLLSMRLRPPTFKCPSCGATMPNEQYRAGKPWICPACSGQFQTSRTYGNIVGWGTTALTLVFFYLLGIRGPHLLVATVVMWFPVLLISTFVLDRLLPPRLEPYVPRRSRSSGRDSGLSIR